MVEGSFFTRNINLLNVFGSNDDKPALSEDKFFLMGDLLDLDKIIMAGDRNCTHRSSGTYTFHP